MDAPRASSVKNLVEATSSDLLEQEKVQKSRSTIPL